MDIVEGSIAAIAAGFTGWAAYSARQAAREANRTAASIAQIERDRWHRELTPNVKFRLTKERGWVELLVQYNGPAALGRLDRLELTVRDDRDRSNDLLLAGGITAEERAATIWGPLRFKHSTDGVDDLGRTLEPFSLVCSEEHRLALDPTHPHQHYNGGAEQWERDHRDKPFRQWVTCHAEGHKPWVLTADIPQRHGESTPSRWTQAR